MKKIILIFLLWFLNPLIINIVWSQDTTSTKGIKVTYTFLSQKTDFLGEPFIYQFDTYLYINDTMSQFIFDRKPIQRRIGNYRISIGKYKYINNFYFDSQMIEEQRELEDGSLLKAQWPLDYEWEITNDTKTIKGIKVRKAITQSIEIDPNEDTYYGKVIAWFAEDIPIPSGPLRYYGLPGLILEIEYENSIKKATLKSIEFDTEINMKDISEGAKLDDKRDIIYYYHFNPQKVKKALKNYQKEKK